MVKDVIYSYEGGPIELNEFSQDDYKSELLGNFIKNKVLKTIPKRRGAYATESGTISDKVNFCQKAIGQMKD